MARAASGDVEAAIAPFSFNLDRLRRITSYEDEQLTRLARGSRRAHEIFVRDGPVTFLGPRVTVNIVHKRIRGLSSPWQADPIQHLEFLWIDEDPVP